MSKSYSLDLKVCLHDRTLTMRSFSWVAALDRYGNAHVTSTKQCQHSNPVLPKQAVSEGL